MEPLIRVEGLTKWFNDKMVLDQLDLTIAKGETLAVFGESGSGKSVLLRTIIGLERAESGHVFFEGEDLTTMSERELRRIRRRIALVFQEGALFDSMSVFDNVAFPLREAGEAPDVVRDKVAEKLAMVGLQDVDELLPAELSGGMKKRVALARGLATEPEVLLYDEPTAGLDPRNTRRVTSLIAELQKKLGVTSIVVTHDVQSAFAIADRVALLIEGRIAEIGPADSFRRSKSSDVRDFLEGGTEARYA
jgi:phospholipid/cholesterol/gamma-HCH transport system ATP-binding protein